MVRDMGQLNLRHEYKYLLSYGAYLQLREVLKKMMKADENSSNVNGYHIRSLYFDDMYDTAWVEKKMGLPKRRKFRIRIYDFGDQVIKLEEKIKLDDYIKKNTSLITRKQYEMIYDGDIDFLFRSPEGLKKNYYFQIKNHLLRPRVIVDYLREAYILPFNQIRITFDKYLSAAKPQKNIFDSQLYSYQVGQEYEIILEIKYNNFLPGHIRNVLELYCTNRLAISKYVIGREYASQRLMGGENG